jgi:ribose transport system ATP-binding protein/rhamnose transport system ATP-binding protein
LAEGVHKSFGGALALEGASIALRLGEIHALVGANGAGKSTLAKIIAGHLKSDQSRITIGGAQTEITSPREAINLGVAMVNQQLSLAPDLSAAENIMLTELCRPERWNRRRVLAQAAEVMKGLVAEGSIDLSWPVRRLAMAQKQMVEIAKALSQKPKIVIFDEPTTSLTPNEVERLFEIMRSLAAQGRGLVFVSHRLEEIFQVTDAVTVLRDGRNICRSTPTKDLDQAALVRLMIGRDLGSDLYSRRKAALSPPQASLAGASPFNASTGASSNPPPLQGAPPGPGRSQDSLVVMSVDKLSSGTLVKDVSFKLRKGEILGLAGLVGAGRTETARAIFGLDRPSGGRIEIEGRPYLPKNPALAYRRGLAMIPEDRRVDGIIPDFQVRENAALTSMSLYSRVLTGYQAFKPAMLSLIDKLALPRTHLDKLILALSGGQQQKVLVSRVLMVKPKILIVDEPTQGVDVATRSEIYSLLRDLAAEGLAIMLISSDFEEILGLADRVVVLAQGRVAADIRADLVDEERLTMFAAPRTSAEGTNLILADLAEKLPRAAVSWIYLDRGLVYCFNQAEGSERPFPGFKAGEIVSMEATALEGLGARSYSWQRAGDLSSLVAPIENSKGQSLGLIAVTVRANESVLLSDSELRSIIEARRLMGPAPLLPLSEASAAMAP